MNIDTRDKYILTLNKNETININKNININIRSKNKIKTKELPNKYSEKKNKKIKYNNVTLDADKIRLEENDNIKKKRK